MYKHTQHTLFHRAKRFIAAHITAAEAVFLSLTLCCVMSVQSDVQYQGHFLERKNITITAVSSAARKQKLFVPRASTSSAKRIAQRDSDHDTLELRPAAPLETSPTRSHSSSKKSVQQLRRAPPAAEPETTNASSPAAHVSSISAVIEFPLFDRTVQPVSRVPNWGAMTKAEQWNRSYEELSEEDFVRVPPYDLNTLTTPMVDLLKDRFNPETIRILTAKLYYSTRFFGKYDIDATEFTAVHPGIDLKLAEGTPIGAIAGGRVHAIRMDEESLGLHAIVEHRAPDGETYYSIYGHMEAALVKAGDTVVPGQTIGHVGMTGHTTGPHIHLQVDHGEPNETFHEIYWPASVPSQGTADAHTVNPIEFIRQFADGE